MAGVITPAQYIGGGGGGAVSSVFGRSGAVAAAIGDYTVAQVTGAAPLASPALTGTPTAPTAGALTNSTQLATTAYTDTAVGVEKTRAQAAEALLAPLASPTFTGTPAAPTGTPGDTSTQLATDAFVAAAVNAAVQGLAVKPSVQEATTTALPANTYSNGASGVGATLTAILPGVLTVDGVAVTLGSRVLVQDEAAAANNGIYVMTTLGTVGVAYVLTRAADMNQAAEVPGAFVFTEAGTVNGGAGFTVSGAGPYTIGTTAINWTQFSGAGEITAGTGLTKTGNTLALTTPVAIANGGTGQATAAAAFNALNPNAAPVNVKVAAPASTVSTTLVMMGCGTTAAYTPASSGLVYVQVTGAVNIATSTTNVLIGPRYGTGTAPANGAAVTGTRFSWSADDGLRPGSTGANGGATLALGDLLSLTPGVPYWFDVAIATQNGSDAASLVNLSFTFMELAA
jgi:hypothetical protein